MDLMLVGFSAAVIALFLAVFALVSIWPVRCGTCGLDMIWRYSEQGGMSPLADAYVVDNWYKCPNGHWSMR